MRHLREAIDVGFQAADEALSTDRDMDKMTGVTALVVLEDCQNRWLVIGWAGNCRAVLGEIQKQTELVHLRVGNQVKEVVKRTFSSVQVTTDHTTVLPDEVQRIRLEGGDVRQVLGGLDEVYIKGEDFPGIPITRCLGNPVARRAGIIGKPELWDRALTTDTCDAKFVALGTDGLFEVLGNAEVCASVHHAKRGNLKFAVDSLVDRANVSWRLKSESRNHGQVTVDDITLMVYWFEPVRGRTADLDV